MTRVVLYTRFERFWHWTMSLLILGMLITGFEVHGSFRLLGFELAADLHTRLAWVLIGLWTFAIFWHLTTGEWRQYIPTSRNRLMAMIRYYMVDIFLGGGHPHHQTREDKLNPLQRMAYLSLHLLITPLVWISGLLYLFYTSLADAGLNPRLEPVALTHTAAAFAMLTFLVVHLYLSITTSEKPLGYVKAMITGHEHK